MQYLLIKFLSLFFVSYVTTFILVPMLSRLAFKIGVVDSPDGKLKMHEKVTPYLGGVAIYLGFILALIFSFILLDFVITKQIVLFLLGITVLLIVGLIDDFIVIRPIHKLMGQFIAASIFVYGGFYLNLTIYPLINNILSIFWFLVISNAINLVDIMDGLATTIAIWVSISFLLLALFFGKYDLIVLLISILGALVAFLFYNKPPARMYLGDAGSLFIGGFLGAMPFLVKDFGSFDLPDIISIFLILLLPLLELVSLIIIRLYKNIPFYLGSPDHFAIYLQKKGWQKKEILIYVSFLAIILFFISFFYAMHYIRLTGLLFSLAVFVLSWCIILF